MGALHPMGEHHLLPQGLGIEDAETGGFQHLHQAGQAVAAVVARVAQSLEIVVTVEFPRFFGRDVVDVDEPAARFQYPEHLAHRGRNVREMMRCDAHRYRIERTRLNGDVLGVCSEIGDVPDSSLFTQPARGVEHPGGQIARDDVAAFIRHLEGGVARARGDVQMDPAARVQHLGRAREGAAPRVGRAGDVVVRILVVYLLYGLSLLPGRVHAAPQ